MERSVLLNLGVRADFSQAQGSLRGLAGELRTSRDAAGGLQGALRFPAQPSRLPDVAAPRGGPAPHQGVGAVATKEHADEIEKMARATLKLNEAMDPARLRERAKGMIELNLAQRKYAEALADAVAREQAGGLGVLGERIGGRLGKLLFTIGKVSKATGGLFGGGGAAAPEAGAAAKAPGQAADARPLAELGQAARDAASALRGLKSASGPGAGPTTPAAPGAARGQGFASPAKPLPGFGKGGQGGGGKGVGDFTGGGGEAGEGAAAGGEGAAMKGAAGGAIIAIAALAAAAGAAAASVKLIGLANPAGVERFMTALDDAGAVVGRVLSPALDLVTEIVRDFGDELGSMLASSSEVKSLMDELRPPLAEVKKVMLELAPVIKSTLTGGLQLFAFGLKNAVILIKPLIDGLVRGAKAFNEWFFMGQHQEATATGVGAAAGPAKENQLADISKELIVNAFKVGAPDSKEDPQEHIKNKLDVLVEQVKDFAGMVEKYLEAAGQVAARVKEKAGSEVEGFKRGFLHPIDAIRGY